jgi:hypothetical protein
VFHNQTIYCFLGWTRNKVAECGANLAGLPARTGRDGKIARVAERPTRDARHGSGCSEAEVFWAEFPRVDLPRPGWTPPARARASRRRSLGVQPDWHRRRAHFMRNMLADGWKSRGRVVSALAQDRPWPTRAQWRRARRVPVATLDLPNRTKTASFCSCIVHENPRDNKRSGQSSGRAR